MSEIEPMSLATAPSASAEVSAVDASLEPAPDPGASVSGASVSGASVSGASLSGANDVEPAPSSTRDDPAMAELFELFEGPLRGVTFPEVSHAALVALRDEVEASMAERERTADALAAAERRLAEAEALVVEARAALQASEATVDERQRALLARAQRALSYAKVYAETDPDLHARLSAIALSRIAQRKPAARDARPRPLTLTSAPGAPAAPGVAPRKRGRPRKVETVAVSVSG